jgi:ABC-2 type transport system ATP-binding protein
MTNNKNKAMIEAENLTKIFNKRPVIDQLSITFNRGERISLSGPNGAGKTTLMRCLLGQYVYDGTLLVDGRDPRKHHQEIMKNIGFVPQVPPPLKMTIKELLNFFEKLTRVKRDRFIEIADEMGLQVNLNLRKPFFKLSGGMKQKLLVAFALGRDPEILLMDEPAANLDPAARTIFFNRLHNYNKNALMILCSHRMSEISTLVTRAIEMDLGKITVDEKINH